MIKLKRLYLFIFKETNSYLTSKFFDLKIIGVKKFSEIS